MNHTIVPKRLNMSKTTTDMSVETQCSDVISSKTFIPSERQFEQWARAALVQQSQEDAELFIRVVDSEESRALNAEYRDKDKPTNVLSFAMEAPEYIEPRVLGDLIICADIVEQEAQQQAKPCEAHWAHMVVHGVLHLLGFDHQTDEGAVAMESLEIEILQGLGYANPYDDSFASQLA